MLALFKFKKFLVLVVSLLLAPTSVLSAEADKIGDWWLVYSIGTGKNNITFVADLTSVTPPIKTGGVQSVEVSQIFADPSKPLVDAYSVEVQCSKHRARFVKGTSIERAGKARRDLKPSSEWKTLDDMALLYTFAFVCNPRDRVINGMSFGKLTHMQLLGMVMDLQAPPKTPLEELDQMLGNKPSKQSW